MDNDVKKHFENIAGDYDSYKKKNWYYYDSLKGLLKKFIPAGKKVIEIGCGTGDLLAEVNPSYGLGIDISRKMIEIARKKHRAKNLQFKTGDICNFYFKSHFDFIMMADVIEHLADVNKSLINVARLMDKRTIFINLMVNPKWEWIFILAEKLGLKMPEGPHNRIPFSVIKAILNKEGVEVIKHGFSTLMPKYIPAVTPFINNWLEPIFYPYACIEYFAAKKVI